MKVRFSSLKCREEGTQHSIHKTTEDGGKMMIKWWWAETNLVLF